MIHLTGFDLFAWATGLLFVLVVRGRARSFPFFTVYIAEHITSTSAAFFIFCGAGNSGRGEDADLHSQPTGGE